MLKKQGKSRVACDYRRLPSFARLGRPGAAVPTQPWTGRSPVATRPFMALALVGRRIVGSALRRIAADLRGRDLTGRLRHPEIALSEGWRTAARRGGVWLLGLCPFALRRGPLRQFARGACRLDHR